MKRISITSSKTQLQKGSRKEYCFALVASGIPGHFAKEGGRRQRYTGGVGNK